MSIFKCKMCGGTIEFEPDSTVGMCDHCGTKQTLPRLDDDRKANLYDRADHFRRNNDFDKAAGIYETLLNEDKTDAEAYWLLVLCRYGVEYVEDPATRKRIPTVNRAQYTSIFDDADYRSALEYADAQQRTIYESEAAAINEIQKGILAISQKEEPFDVFICYKETDAQERRTQDSVLATDLYHQLVNEGFKVFFSRITLEDKLGTAYEPYIFAALNSAKVMVVLGTKPDYFNAVWVKNEWSRYLALVKASNGKKILIPAYRDMDPYDLPEEFSHLQAQDMSKLGFMQDLIRGIKKLTEKDEPQPTLVKETVVRQNESGNLSAILDRGYLALEDGEWSKADGFFEQALNFDAQNARAYLGKLMAEQQVRKQMDLQNCAMPFDNSKNYEKALRFGDAELADTLKEYVTYIKDRNETARLMGIYNGATNAMNTASTESAFKAAAAKFKTIPGFKDADRLVQKCLDRAEDCRKDAIYASAKEQMERKDAVFCYESAIKSFQTIPGWKDADEQIYACQRKIEEIMAKEEADRLKRERQAEQKRIAAEKAAKKRKKIFAISVSVLALIIAVTVLLKIVILTAKKNAFIEQYNQDVFDRFGIVEEGKIINFGSYEQDNNTSNGKEKIEWLVLTMEDKKALIISKYAIDCQQYHTSFTSVTWENCSLCKWLNETFINAAFTSEEQNSIIYSSVTADMNPSYSTFPGKNTSEKIFLLSIMEVNKYFSSDEERKCVATDYAIAQGATFYTTSGRAVCQWWLRTPGYANFSTAFVALDGSSRDIGMEVNYDLIAVRPAMWIDLS